MSIDVLRDIVESVGATLVVDRKPTHPEGRLLYPSLTVAYHGRSFTTQRATFSLCAEDVERWLAQEVR